MGRHAKVPVEIGTDHYFAGPKLDVEHDIVLSDRSPIPCCPISAGWPTADKAEFKTLPFSAYAHNSAHYPFWTRIFINYISYPIDLQYGTFLKSQSLMSIPSRKLTERFCMEAIAMRHMGARLQGG